MAGGTCGIQEEGKGRVGIVHKARIITYVNMKNPKKPKRTRLLTNDLETAYEEIVATYDG